MKFILLLFCPFFVVAQTIVRNPYTLVSNQYPGHIIPAELCTLDVPENHAAPTSTSIKLKFLFIPSVSTKPAAPILYLAGGPGFSGISNASGDIFPIIEALRSLSDVIVLDQRGTGQEGERLHFLGQNFVLPYESSLLAPETGNYLAENIQLWKTSLENKGININHYNTMSSAKDIDVLRKALHIDQLNLWAFSYGSHLAFAYAKYFPQHVQRLVAAGINNLDDRYRNPKDGDVLIRKVSEMVSKYPALHQRIPNLYESLWEIMLRLEKQPIRIKKLPFSSEKIDIPLTKEDLQIALVTIASQSWFVKDLPAFVLQMMDQDFSFAASYLRNFVKNGINQVRTPILFSMHCASGVEPEKKVQIEKEAKQSITGNAINYPFMHFNVCEWWGTTDLGSSFREPFRSDIPALFFQGDLDGRTSYQNAVTASQQFKQGKLIKVVNGQHDIWSLSPMIIQSIIDFFSGKSITIDSIVAPEIEFRSPDDEKVMQELYTICIKEGAAKMISLFEQMKSDPAHRVFVTNTTFKTVIQRMVRERKVNVIGDLLAYACSLDEKDARIRQQYGEYLIATGNKEKAKEVLLEAYAINPFNLNVKKMIQ